MPNNKKKQNRPKSTPPTVSAKTRVTDSIISDVSTYQSFKEVTRSSSANNTSQNNQCTLWQNINIDVDILYNELISANPGTYNPDVIYVLDLFEQDLTTYRREYTRSDGEDAKVKQCLSSAVTVIRQIRNDAENNTSISKDGKLNWPQPLPAAYITPVKYYHQALGVISACKEVVTIHTPKSQLANNLQSLETKARGNINSQSNNTSSASTDIKTQIARGKLLLLHNLVEHYRDEYLNATVFQGKVIAEQRQKSLRDTLEENTKTTPEKVELMALEIAEKTYSKFLQFIRKQQTATQQDHQNGWGYSLFGTTSKLATQYQKILDEVSKENTEIASNSNKNSKIAVLNHAMLIRH
jgi:hypothetical protein